MKITNPMQTLTAFGLTVIMAMTMSAWTCSKTPQDWLNTSNTLLPVLEQQAQNILAITDPADAALAATVSKGVSAGLTLVTDAINAYKANPSATTLENVAAAFDKAGADLPALLKGMQFSDPNVGLAIEAGVTAIVASLDILAAQLPTSKSAKAARARATRMKQAKANPDLSPAAVRANWNAKVCDPRPIAHCPRM